METLEEDPFAALSAAQRGETHPQQLRAQLQATLAKLLQAGNTTAKADLAKIRDTKASIGMLAQLQALKRKADINPVQQLKDRIKKDSVRQYPANWKQLTHMYYRK